MAHDLLRVQHLEGPGSALRPGGVEGHRGPGDAGGAENGEDHEKSGGHGVFWWFFKGGNVWFDVV